MPGVMTDQVWEDARCSCEFPGRLAVRELDARLRRFVAWMDSRGEGVALAVFNALGWSRTDAVFASVAFMEWKADGLWACSTRTAKWSRCSSWRQNGPTAGRYSE